MTDQLAIQITDVSYSRLRSMGYENEKVSATAHLQPGQDPNDVLEELVAWVADKLGDTNEQLSLETKKNELRNSTAEVERAYEYAKLRWEKARCFLKLHGLEAPLWHGLDTDFYEK